MCLVIPAYNEEKRISSTLESIVGSLLKKYTRMSVIVAVQGEDRTMEIVQQISRKSPRVRALDCRKTSGKGINLIRGFEAALKSGPAIVGFADADGSVPPDQLEKLMTALQRDRVQGVMASRYLPGSRIVGRQPKTRWLASRLYNAMVRLLFGFDFTDTQCGAKFFSSGALRAVMRNVKLTEMSFDINLLYEMKRQGLPVEEVPIIYHMQSEGSKVKVSKQIPKMFVVTTSYRVTRSPLGKIFPARFKSAVYRRVRKW